MGLLFRTAVMTLTLCLLILHLFPGAASAQAGWQVVGLGRLPFDVGWGNGLYVAVGAGGAILTSPDGINWTEQSSPTSRPLFGVAYGAGTWVAVGSDVILTSPDGSAWSVVPGVPSGDLLWDVAYGPGGFVAIADDGDVYTSPDGTAWSSQAVVDTRFESVTYAGGQYLASAIAGFSESDPRGVVLRSPDPASVAWDVYDFGSLSFGVTDVTYGNGVYVALDPDGWALVSADWQNWTQVDVGAEVFTQVRAVDYGGGRFVIVGDAAAGPVTDQIFTSTDGLNWTLEASGGNEDWNDVTYGDGRFVAVGFLMAATSQGAPAATADAYTASGASLTAAAPGVLGNDTDPEDDALTAVLASGPSDGSVTLNADGSFTYAADPGFSGTDQFTYVAYDGWLQSDPVTVTISGIDASASSSDAEPWWADLCPDDPRVTCIVFPPADGGTMRERSGAFTLEFPPGAVDAPSGRMVRVLVTTHTAEETAALWPGDAPSSLRSTGTAFTIEGEILLPGENTRVTGLLRPAEFRVRSGAGPAGGALFESTDDGLVFVGGALDGGHVAAKLSRLGRYVLAVQDVSFPDLEGHWARADIERLASRFVVRGFPDGLFHPDFGVTRAQFAALLWRAVGPTLAAGDGDAGAGAESPFVDVQSGDWFHPEVTAAAAVRIVKGFGDGTFRPDLPVTREQAAAMIVRALQAQGRAGAVPDRAAAAELLAAFADAAQVSDWAVEELALAVLEAVVVGLPGDDAPSLAPQAGTTRAEAAVMIAR